MHDTVHAHIQHLTSIKYTPVAIARYQWSCLFKWISMKKYSCT